MRKGRLEAAERLLKDSVDTLPAPAHRLMLAHLKLRQKKYADLISVVAEIPAASGPGSKAGVLRLRALLELDRLDDARTQLASLTDDQRADPVLATVMAQALFRAGAWQEAHDWAERARALGGDASSLSRLSLHAQAALGATDADLIALVFGRKDGVEPTEAFNLAAVALMTGRLELLNTLADRLGAVSTAMSPLVDQTFRLLRQNRVFLDDATPRVIGTIASTATALMIDRAEQHPLEEIYDLARILYDNERMEEGAQIKALYLERAKTRTNWVVPSPNNRPAIAQAINQPPDDTLEAMANWLNVDMFRDEWKARVRENVNMEVELTMALHNSADAFAEFSALVGTPDASPLEDLVERNEPAILVGTHMGYLTGLLALRVRVDLPVRVFGATRLDSELFPAGECFVPTPKSATYLETARNLLRLLREKQIVAITGDIPRGARSLPFKGPGWELKLPDSVPQLAHRHGVRAYWLCLHWRNRELVSAFEPMPMPEPDERYESYRDRWLELFLAKVRDVALADERNILPFGGIRLPRTPAADP